MSSKPKAAAPDAAKPETRVESAAPPKPDEPVHADVSNVAATSKDEPVLASKPKSGGDAKKTGSHSNAADASSSLAPARAEGVTEPFMCGMPTSTGDKAPVSLIFPGGLFKIVKGTRWFFFNDTTDKVFEIRYTFEKKGNAVQALENTEMEVNEEGNTVASMVIQPLETKSFVEGSVDGEYFGNLCEVSDAEDRTTLVQGFDHGKLNNRRSAVGEGEINCEYDELLFKIVDETNTWHFYNDSPTREIRVTYTFKQPCTVTALGKTKLTPGENNTQIATLAVGPLQTEPFISDMGYAMCFRSFL